MADFFVKSMGAVQFINGALACGPTCNAVHPGDAGYCLMCGYPMSNYHNGHTCLTDPNKGQRGSFPL